MSEWYPVLSRIETNSFLSGKDFSASEWYPVLSRIETPRLRVGLPPPVRVVSSFK